MRTLLINPPYPFSEVPIMPAGLAYIAGVLEQNGNEVGILDLLVSKYDANRPVTRTEGAGPEDIIAVLHRYYRGLRLTPDMLEGVKSDQEEIEKSKRRSPLAWALLRGDVIENLGMMELQGDPVEDLANRLAQIVRYPNHQVSERIKKWVEEGLLKYDLDGEHLVWRWS